jgi:hypothetical protein
MTHILRGHVGVVWNGGELLRLGGSAEDIARVAPPRNPPQGITTLASYGAESELSVEFDLSAGTAEFIGVFNEGHAAIDLPRPVDLFQSDKEAVLAALRAQVPVELTESGFVLPDLDVAFWPPDDESEPFQQASVAKRGYFSNAIRVERALAAGVCHPPIPPGPGEPTRGWAFSVNDELGDDGLRQLISNLNEVPLLGMSLSGLHNDRHLAMLGSTASIADINLTLAEVTAVGLAHLASLPSLTELSLTHIQFPANGMEAIGRCGGLLSLTLEQTGAKDADLTPLSQLTSLRILDVTGAKITGKSAAVFEPLVDLECLCLSETKIDDRVCDVLAGLPRLRQLVLFECRVTDRGVRRLADLKQLQFLNANGRGISDAAKDAVRARTGALVV